MLKNIKQFYKIFFLSKIIIFINCTVLSSEEISFSDLNKRNNLYFYKDSDIPFEGVVEGKESGAFINGKKEGDGILTYKDGTVLYKGTYVHDTWHGEGEWQDLYGTWYKGTFVLGKRTGSGEVQLSNGHFYKGDFLDGKYHGKGVLVKRKVVCDGYFKNGEYLESNDEREERLKVEEKERKRRELKKNAIAEQMRRRDAALKRRADAKAKAMSKILLICK